MSLATQAREISLPVPWLNPVPVPVPVPVPGFFALSTRDSDLNGVLYKGYFPFPFFKNTGKGEGIVKHYALKIGV